jgi:hypothetical protein
MWITGYTSNRLNEVRTLDRNQPYKIGVNGVFNVQSDFIEYEIGGVLFKTFLNGTISVLNTVSPQDRAGTSFYKYRRFYSTPSRTLNPTNRRDTIFKIEKTVDDFEYKPLIKEEEKLEQVFLPEIDDQIFIERAYSNIYEKHMRLMDIRNIGQLETYKNGFYNIKKG